MSWESMAMAKRDNDSRHDLSNDFVRMLSDDWQENGKAALERVRKEDPRGYCELIAKIVPKEMLIAADNHKKTDAAPQTSRDIANMLLADLGLTAPSDNDRAKALEAYDEMNVKLEQVAYEALH
jgi:hypothetical protein